MDRAVDHRSGLRAGCNSSPFAGWQVHADTLLCILRWRGCVSWPGVDCDRDARRMLVRGSTAPGTGTAAAGIEQPSRLNQSIAQLPETQELRSGKGSSGPCGASWLGP